jgi:hypothetical protein
MAAKDIPETAILRPSGLFEYLFMPSQPKTFMPSQLKNVLPQASGTDP